MTSPETPIDAVHADERMLDQLAARSYGGHDELAVALGAWANNVDAEAATALHNVDLTELIRKHSATPGVYEMAQPPTTIRIRGSRLLATLGGAGVAAAALGIVLANVHNLPGFEPVIPVGTSTSAFVDVVHLANAVKAEFEAKIISKAIAIQSIEKLVRQAPDSRVKDDLNTVLLQVKTAKVTAPTTSAPPTKSASADPVLPGVNLPGSPSLMTTPVSSSHPQAPEQATSTQQPSTQPGSSSTLGSIPSDATSTPVPSSTPPSTGLPSTASPGTVSPSTASTSTGSSSTGTSTSSGSQRVKKPVNKKMPKRPSSTVTKGAPASASAPTASASDLGASAAEASVR